MYYSVITLLTTAAQALALPVALIATIIAAAVYWRQRSAVLTVVRQPGSVQSPPTIIYNDAPTVRVVDSQRVDRLRKVVQLASGAYVDILEAYADGRPRFRVTLKAVMEGAQSAAAHIAIEFRGATVSCGPLVQEIARNEFALPRATRDDPRCIAFHYHERGDALDFMRIKVRAIDLQMQTVDIDVMQVEAHWPSGCDVIK